MTPRHTGNAPCGWCGHHIYNIILRYNLRELDGRGGFWCPTEPIRCPHCGKLLNRFHAPGPMRLGIPISIVSTADKEETTC